MQINRLFEIVHLLLNKKSTTSRELAEHFEVSTRTILRDIDTLSQAGIPIYTTQGKGGGISILDNYVLNKTTISEEEQNQILFGLQSFASVQHEDQDVDELLGKLRTLFDKLDTNWIEVDFSRWGKAGPDKEKFELLKTAITGRRAVYFSYLSSYGNKSSRTVYPLKLIFKSKAWYLQAYCKLKCDYRVFKINRILSLEVLSESFTDMDLHVPPLETDTPPAMSHTHLELLFSPYAAYRIYDEFNDSEIIKNENGTFTVIIDFPEDSWLYSFILSFGSLVEVISPPEIRDWLAKELDKAKKIYL